MAFLSRRCTIRGLERSALACIALLAAVTSGRAAEPGFKEPEVKAVFLFHFAQFVDWPSEAFANPKAELVIGVLGDDPFGQVLDQVILKEIVGERQLAVERYRRVEDIHTCHILFISPSEAQRYGQIFARLRGRRILTVGDTEGFAAGGGMIRFLSDQNRIRLRVNVKAARAAGLTISSKLLRAAEIVGD